jgi:hypothetical protein
MTTRKHLFHILPLSPWPLFVGIGAFFFVSSLTFYMHGILYANIPLIFGLIILIKSCFSWVDDIIDEATCAGDHTIGVQMGITSGFLLLLSLK